MSVTPEEPRTLRRTLAILAATAIAFSALVAGPVTSAIGDPDDPPTSICEEPTGEPSDDPTDEPSDEPSDEPTDEPSDDPSDEPTDEPSDEPTDEPSDDPTDDPSDDPSEDPCDEPVDESDCETAGDFSIIGTYTVPLNANPVISVYSVTEDGPVFCEEAVLEEGGSYTLPNLAAGFYIIGIEDAGVGEADGRYLSRFYSSTVAGGIVTDDIEDERITTVLLSDGELDAIDLTLGYVSFPQKLAPKIVGTVAYGQELEVIPGAWTDEADVKYQWYRSNVALKNEDTELYDIVGADRGTVLSVKVSVSAFGYLTKSTTVATSKVPLSRFSLTTPTFKGDAIVGKTLTANPAKVSPSKGVKLTYQWLRNGKDISKATGITHKLTADDAGQKITFEVTASLAGYETASKVSAASASVKKTFVTKPVPTITGSAVVGKTLLAKTGIWAPRGVTFTYQWLSDGNEIDKATSSSYKIPSKYKKTTISVVVTGSLDGYVSASVQSKATAKVAAAK